MSSVHLPLMQHTPPAPVVRLGTAVDLPFVQHLQRVYSNQLGFLPGAALRWYLDNGRCSIVFENGDPAGYTLGRPRLRAQPWVQPLTQTAVSFDVQRRSHGTALVEAAAADAVRNGRTILQAWCRTDIPANAFWLAAGFEPLALRRPETARSQPLLLWRRCLDERQRPLLAALPAAAGWKASTATAVVPLTATERQLIRVLAQAIDLDQLPRVAVNRLRHERP